MQLKFRKASIEDAQLLFDWRNDPFTREMSGTNEEITLDEHITWLKRKLDDPGVYLYILSDGINNIGQLRLEPIKKEFIISYSIAKEFRSRGFGKIIIKMIIDEFPESVFIAFVKKENYQSSKILTSLGFENYKSYDENTELLKFYLKL